MAKESIPKNYTLPNRASARSFLKTLLSTNPEFFFLADYFLEVKGKAGRYFINYLRSEAHELETIFDDAEAFSNELFFFRELMAGIRWFCRAAFTLEEGIISRYDTRKLKEGTAEKEDLLFAADGVLSYFYQTIQRLCAESLHLVKNYGLPLPEKSNLDTYIKLQGQPRLERNRLVSSTTTQLDAVELLTTEFIGVAEALSKLKERLVKENLFVNEGDVSHILSGFHSLESFYDTHIHNTDIEKKEPDFWSLRGYIAMGLRFFEVMRDLTHFYERHILVTKDRMIKDRFNELLNEPRLVSVIVDFALNRAERYSTDGSVLALTLLAKCTGRVRRLMKIPVGVDGIHARPMTWMYKVSQKYGRVTFEIGGEKFETDSMLSMLTMTEAIDRVIGLTDKEGQIAVATGTVINELSKRKGPITVEGKRYWSQMLVNILEVFRSEIRDKAGTRFVDVVANGPKEAIDEIEIMAKNYFKKELLPPSLSYLFND